MLDIQTCIADLASPDPQLRIDACLMLRKLGTSARPAIPALKQVMVDTSEPYMQIVAAGAISRIAPEDPSPTPILVAGLEHTVSLNRAAAIEFLGQRDCKTEVLKAMPLLNDSDFLVRFATAKAIGTTLGLWSHAVAICVKMLKNENATDRAIGGACLWNVRRHVRDHLDLLTVAIADCSWEARLDLEEILHQLRNP